MTVSVFVSRPTATSSEQRRFCQHLVLELEAMGLEPVTVGVDLFANTAPLVTVRNVLRDCHGALILGLKQTFVEACVMKVGTPEARQVSNAFLPTTWNHVEGGMAYGLGLPMMVIRESDLVAEGLFDHGSSDSFVHSAVLDLSWLASEAFRQPFADWVADVLRHTQGAPA